jgi:hypothetical protein
MQHTQCKNLAEVIAGCWTRDETVWDALWEDQPIGRLAVAIIPSKERKERAKQFCSSLQLKEPKAKSPRWTEQWREALVDALVGLRAEMQLPGDSFPALYVPRFVHSQSQGICDIFGVEVESQEGGLFFVHPLPADPKQVKTLEPQPFNTSRYWGAVEWIRYARAVTNGLFTFRNPVLTGPFDTANYLLGTTVLMEWVYTESSTVHILLEKITNVLVDMIFALKEAAGGVLHSDSFLCMRGGVCLCSECRSLVSQEVYEEFESPYLRRLGEEIGTYGIHSCGNWERTVLSAIADPNFRAMNGQVRENDLSKLCELAKGRITLSIGPSKDLHERYTWQSMEAFYLYILETVPRTQPFELSVAEEDIPLWNRLCEKTGAGFNSLPTGFD